MVRDQEVYSLPGDNDHKEYLARRAQPNVYVLLRLVVPREYLVVLGDKVLDPQTLNVVCRADELLQLQYPES